MSNSYLAAILALSLIGGIAASASAQEDDAGSIVYASARNKIGLLRYCRTATFLDSAMAELAIGVVQGGLERLAPDGVDEEQGNKAEKAGEAGLWGPNSKRDLANVARLFRTTPAGLCREWAEETLKIQKAQEQASGAPGATLLSARARPLPREAVAAPKPPAKLVKRPSLPAKTASPVKAATANPPPAAAPPAPTPLVPTPPAPTVIAPASPPTHQWGMDVFRRGKPWQL